MLWRALKFDELCSELLPRGRERVAWAEVIAILVIARLCEPSSDELKECRQPNDAARHHAFDLADRLSPDRTNADDALRRHALSALWRSDRAIAG